MVEEIKEVKEKKEQKKKEPVAEKGAVANAPAQTAGETAPAVKVKKKIKKNVAVGVVHIQATFNNTIITVTDTKGNVLAWATSGGKGFKGSKKGTPFAAQLASETACKKAQDYGVRTVSVIVRGPGAGRESAVRAIAHTGIRVTSIRDLTPIPHNGCRPPKQRRV